MEGREEVSHRPAIWLFQLAALMCAGMPGVAVAGEGAAPKGPLLPPAPSAATIDSVLGKGVAYLVSHQNENGSWGSFESARPYEVLLGTTASHGAFGDATTALCLMALIEPARSDPDAARAVGKAARYLFSKKPVRRASGKVLYNVWSQTYVLEAASAVLRESRLKELHASARKAGDGQLKALHEIQASDGGFGYYDFNFAASHPTGAQSCSFTTAAVLVALRHAADAGLVVSDEFRRDAVRSLARLRLPSGAYVYGVYLRNHPQAAGNAVKGSLGRSQVCNLALWLNREGVTKEDLRTGLDHLFRHHHFIEMGRGRPYPHESWYQTAGYYFFFGHYYASLVACELPGDEGTGYLGGLASVMCRLQDPDGSWWDFPLYGYHKAYGTAFAVLALQRVPRAPGLPEH